MATIQELGVRIGDKVRFPSNNMAMRHTAEIVGIKKDNPNIGGVFIHPPELDLQGDIYIQQADGSFRDVPAESYYVKSLGYYRLRPSQKPEEGERYVQLMRPYYGGYEPLTWKQTLRTLPKAIWDCLINPVPQGTW